MQKNLQIRLLPHEAASDHEILLAISRETGISRERIKGFNKLKQSLDARSRTIWVNLTLIIYVDEPFLQIDPVSFQFRDVSGTSKKVVIVGAGPAGLFAALRLIELGIQPIIIERGKEVRARRRDLAAMNKEGIVNPDSNYCFGEGGAGTYSDGKLYTRSNKRGDINRILNLFVHFGADRNILYQAHPHIGTNKLPTIISAMRSLILERGGQYHFEKKLVDFNHHGNHLNELICGDGDTLSAKALILATGHSARDVFELLDRKKILIESKPFALGVRVEHPQSFIDAAQYHCVARGEFLPPASYSLVDQVEQRGVFSFCMCPGGIIAPAATQAGEIVVNGWSPSKRNNPFANSGMVVSVEEMDLKGFKMHGALAAMRFQQSIEQRAFNQGGGKLVAPAQRLEDFVKNKISASLPDCSYLPGIQSADLREVLPPFVHQALQKAFRSFDKKMRGYLSNDAVVVATESRTSSPVRIPRQEKSLHHPQLKNLFPCGEGAGYAGGIISAAMDGQKIAEAAAAAI
jgi:uncharacterized FAD-dependent dehydrogenase